MLGSTWNYSLIQKNIVLFGALFNSIYINRMNSSNNAVQSIQVPVSFSPKEKFLALSMNDPKFEKNAITLPRIGFADVSYSYDSDRRLPALNQNSVLSKVHANKRDALYSPSPYTIQFETFIMTKNKEDLYQILEQILPMFTPSYTIYSNLISEFGITHDIPVTLTDVTTQDIYEGNFSDLRLITATLKFNMQTYFYGPSKSVPVINETIVQVMASANLDSTNTFTQGFQITTIPGQMANGQPTTNSELTIDRNLIWANSQFDYIQKTVDTTK